MSHRNLQVIPFCVLALVYLQTNELQGLKKENEES